jgi:hypothetical protein
MGHGMAGRHLDAGFSVKDTIMLAILDANLAGVGLHTSICPVTGLPDAAASGKLMLLADAPLLGRAAVEAYARATAEMPDDDEGRMIEIVSRPR